MFRIKILSWLLLHANRYSFGLFGKAIFYEIKNELLKRYGRVIGQDLQFIPGRICYSCDGTGIYRRYFYYTNGIKHRGYESCWKCTRGFYKRPFWSLLDRVQFGKYVFHLPVRRIYDASELLPIKDLPTVFHGYVNHRWTGWSESAAFILIWIFRRNYMRRMSSGYNRGWRPSRLIHKFCHIYYFGKDSIPYGDFLQKKERFIENCKTKIYGFFQSIVEKIYSIQDDLVEPSKEEKQTELLAKIYWKLPSNFGLVRSFWGEFALVEVKHSRFHETIETGSLEEIYEYIKQEFEEDEIPF